MPEPDRKAQLLEDLRWALAPCIGLYSAADAALEAALPHIDAAYQRGLMAGRSQTGYTTRRKSKEQPCAPSAGSPSPASTTRDP